MRAGGDVVGKIRNLVGGGVGAILRGGGVGASLAGTNRVVVGIGTHRNIYVGRVAGTNNNVVDVLTNQHVVVDCRQFVGGGGRQEAIHTTEEEVEESETCNGPCIAIGMCCRGDRVAHGGDSRALWLLGC